MTSIRRGVRIESDWPDCFALLQLYSYKAVLVAEGLAVSVAVCANGFKNFLPFCLTASSLLPP